MSDDTGGAGGSTLQLWRISDFITRPEAEVVAELETHRNSILAAGPAGAWTAAATAAPVAGAGAGAAEAPPPVPVAAGEVKGEGEGDAGAKAAAGGPAAAAEPMES